MARPRKLLPARSRDAVDESALIRSAETLGRMIGSLQRQLDGATKRLSQPLNAFKSAPSDGNGNGPTDAVRAKPRNRARAAGVGRSASGAMKTQSTADRTSKRASKSARAKKSAGRSGSRKAAASRNRRG